MMGFCEGLLSLTNIKETKALRYLSCRMLRRLQSGSLIQRSMTLDFLYAYLRKFLHRMK